MGASTRILRAARVLTLSLLTSVGVWSQASSDETQELFEPLVLDGAKVRWQGTIIGRGARITYAFADRTIVTPGARNCGVITPLKPLLLNSALSFKTARTALDQALARWERVADVEFVETSETEGADIVIGAQAVPFGRAFANVATQGRHRDGVSEISRSLVCLNPGHRWKLGFDGDLAVYDLVHTFTHEIGHAIGLDHPRGSGHVMSRRYDERIAGLSEGDIAGAVAMYGPRPDVRSVAFDKGSRRGPRQQDAMTANSSVSENLAIGSKPDNEK